MTSTARRLSCGFLSQDQVSFAPTHMAIYCLSKMPSSIALAVDKVLANVPHLCTAILWCEHRAGVGSADLRAPALLLDNYLMTMVAFKRH